MTKFLAALWFGVFLIFAVSAVVVWRLTKS